MSEKNRNTDEFDLMMRSILDEAREEVPERVWEGVSVGLDKAARRRTVVLWWRSVAAVAAVAAAVAIGVFFNHDDGNVMVEKAGGDMIAVVEQEIVEEEEVIGNVPEIMTMIAEAEEAVGGPVAAEVAPESAADMIREAAGGVRETESAATEGESMSGEGEKTEKPAAEPVKKNVIQENAGEYFPEDWGEEKAGKKRNVSLVLSGVAGTNNALSQNRLGPMMRPSVTPAPKKTGIEETSVKSSYGIPLSFGAGVKFDLSQRWSIGAGVNYTYMARQFYGKYTKVSPSGDIESVTSSDIKNQQHYIGIPVNAFFDVISNDKINFYAYAGGTVEKCVSDSYSLLNTSINHSEKVAGVQLSANAGIGVEFMLGKHLGLYIDPSVRYYFKNGNQPKSIRTVQPLMLGFEMGLRARL